MRKIIRIETNGNDVNWFTDGQLWFLSYMWLTTKFRSGFCAGFLYLLMSAAVGLCWCKSSWVIQTSKPTFLGGAALFSSSP